MSGLQIKIRPANLKTIQTEMEKKPIYFFSSFLQSVQMP